MMPRLHAKFNAKILPVVQRWARINLRDDDLVAECIGLAWKWALSLHRRGKDGSRFPSALARYAVRAVHSGRRVGGQLPSKDARSPAAWRRRGFTVQRLPDIETESSNPFMEALAEQLGMGEQASRVARKFRLSPGRVTQIRQRLMRRWREFHGQD